MTKARLSPWLLDLASPALRSLPPWWAVRLYNRLVRNPAEQGGFDRIPRRRRLRPHGYEIDLRLDDWSERLAYFCGCYYDVDGTAVLNALLRPGDTFVDVGANIGFMTLTAAGIVGPSGHVRAFEPNPPTRARLEEACRLSDLDQVRIQPFALSDRDGQAELDLTDHSGTANLRKAEGQRSPSPGPRSASAGSSPDADGGGPPARAVEVRRGDQLLADLPADRPVLFKVDVEGLEGQVLRGTTGLLGSGRAAAMVEVTDAWLREAGSSADEIFGLARSLGLAILSPRVDAWSRLTFTPLTRPRLDRFQYDLVLVPQREPWGGRLKEQQGTESPSS